MKKNFPFLNDTVMFGVGGVVIVLLLAALVLKYRTPTAVTPSPSPLSSSPPSPSPSATLSSLLPSPTPAATPASSPEVGNTGAILPEQTTKEQFIAEKRTELLLSVPIKQPTFQVEYDNQKLKFRVSLKKPYTQSTAKYQTWMSDNGYDLIPQDQWILVFN